MSQIVDQSLQKIAKGTAIAFLGTTIGMLFTFVSRVVLTRFLSQGEYGIYSLAFTILNIAAVISYLGFEQSSARQIAYYRGKADAQKVQRLISSSLQLALIAGILVSVVLFFTSGIISTEIFHEPGLVLPLKIFAIAVPFYVLINILASIFRGFDEVKPRAYFQDILRNGLFLLLLLPVVLVSSSFSARMCTLSASIIVTGIAFAIYTLRRALFTINRYSAINPAGREFLFFSLPLFGVTMLGLILNWTDILMLGYFKTADMVGLYNGALPLAQLIPLALTSMGFIYVPIASQLYSQNLMGEVKRTYQVLTRWVFSVSFPVFLLLFLFPEVVLSFFFGAGYAQAAVALRILSLGFAFHTFFGPNGMALIVMGKTRLLMWATLLAAGSNVVLNVILIPVWGINGAAVASLISYLLLNMVCSVKLYQLFKIQPFTRNYLKPVLACVGVIAIVHVLSRSLLVGSYWMLPVILVLFIGIYGLCLVLTKSFDEEDIMLLSIIGERTGINVEPVKRILKKFL